MSKGTLGLDEALRDYLLSVSLRETKAQRELRAESDRLAMGSMRTAAEQAQLLALLVRLIGCKQVLEIGTFTGYGTLAMALALPEGGTIVACDTSREWTDIGRRYWEQAGVGDRIDLRIAPALETLGALEADMAGRFDLAYIDADKTNLEAYFEHCLRLVRPGGLVAVDNVLWGGSVIDETNRNDSTIAIRAFNAARRDDARVDLSLIPIGDGLTLARRR